MGTESNREWVLPAEIPFNDLKSKDLEACVYWLMDAMGAKDLEWRTGGTGAGAADGGRDLEAHVFLPDDSGEIISQKWWIECKGRSGTVEADEVKCAVNNVLAYDGVDCVVIATNTQFSNPTRDWVKEWQRKYPRPRVQLWDKAQLERYLSRHPDVVLRLFSEALSLQGRFQAMENRFWNKLEFVAPKMLSDLWQERYTIDVTPMGLFAAIANEFANGDITRRPWGAILDTQLLVEVTVVGFQNVPYLLIRLSMAGIDQRIITRTFAYLILNALDILPAESVNELVWSSLNRGEQELFPEEVQEVLLMPIVDQLLSEMRDVCSADCQRISMVERTALTEAKDEIEDYWLRLDPAEREEPGEKRSVRFERLDAKCEVGFPVDEDKGCPLFAFRPTIRNTAEFMDIISRVAAFRKAQAASRRHEK